MSLASLPTYTVLVQRGSFTMAPVQNATRRTAWDAARSAREADPMARVCIMTATGECVVTDDGSLDEARSTPAQVARDEAAAG